jgi:hypothetical protein
VVQLRTGYKRYIRRYPLSAGNRDGWESSLMKTNKLKAAILAYPACSKIWTATNNTEVGSRSRRELLFLAGTRRTGASFWSVRLLWQ